MDRLAAIKEQLELITLGDLPYRETDAEQVEMLREQENILSQIQTTACNLRATITRERQTYDPPLPPKREKKPQILPSKVQEFFHRIKKGVNWGPVQFKLRWQSEDKRFLIWTIPGHQFWNGIGRPRAYAPTSHIVSDLSKMGPEPKFESGLTLSQKCQIREWKGRLTKVQLADMIATMAAKN